MGEEKPCAVALKPAASATLIVAPQRGLAQGRGRSPGAAAGPVAGGGAGP